MPSVVSILGPSAGPSNSGDPPKVPPSTLVLESIPTLLPNCTGKPWMPRRRRQGLGNERRALETLAIRLTLACGVNCDRVLRIETVNAKEGAMNRYWMLLLTRALARMRHGHSSRFNRESTFNRWG